MSDLPREAAARIAAARPGFNPRVGLVLGSGLGPVTDGIADAVKVPYDDLPGFPKPSIAGHGGTVWLGALGGVPVACLSGRAHYYERGEAGVMAPAVRTLKALGCEVLFLTNAAGSLKPEAPAGALMMLTDHINFSGANPLIGEGDHDYGPRFFDMSDAYDPALQDALRGAAERLDITLHEGVYMWFNGPSFETRAEIRMARVLGADAVGMSTAPECIVARQCGLKVAAVSMITNLGAGMSDEPLGHEHTMAMAKEAAGDLTRLIVAFLEDYD